MAGGAAFLFHFQKNRIVIAVRSYLFDCLNMSGTFPLFPERLPGSAEISGSTGIDCFDKRFPAHIGKHQHFSGFMVLCNGGKQTASFFEIESRCVHCKPRFMLVTDHPRSGWLGVYAFASLSSPARGRENKNTPVFQSLTVVTEQKYARVSIVDGCNRGYSPRFENNQSIKTYINNASACQSQLFFNPNPFIT